MKKNKVVFTLILILCTVCLGDVKAEGKNSKEDDGNKISCSSYQAVYKPHPKYVRHDSPKMRLKIEQAHEMNFTNRGPLFYFILLNENDEKVSEMRLAYTCSQGVSICRLNAYWGQFNSIEKLENLDGRISLDIIALEEDFSQANPISKEKAPHLLIFPNTQSEFYHGIISETDKWDKNIHYYTDEKVLPNFGGYDVWVLDDCDREKRTEQIY